jgi:small GTP-binding protein
MMININEITINDDLMNNKFILEGLFYECHCILFVIDLTSKKSFVNLEKFISSLEQNQFIKNDSNYLTIILVLNKSDLEQEIKIDKGEINEFLQKYPLINSIEISSINQKGIPELTQKIYDGFTKNENLSFPLDNLKFNENQYNYRSYDSSNLDTEGTINCMLIGDSETGKSSFLIRYVRNNFSDIFLTTIGLDKEIKIYQHMDKKYRLILWDTAGQERFKSLPKKYFQNADGILLLYDVSKKDTFEHVKNWIEDIKFNLNEERKTNIYLIGNKLDLERNVTREEGLEMARELGIKYFECSNKLNININEIMAHMIMDCSDGIKKEKKENKLKNKRKNKKKKCC